MTQDIVRSAIYVAVSSDGTIMGRLMQAPYIGRLPDGASHTRNKGSIVMQASLVPGIGARNEVTVTLDVYALQSDVADMIVRDLWRLFHPSVPRDQWRSLTVESPHRSFVRVESSDDIPDPTSELEHRTMRLRVLMARGSS